MCVGFFVSIFRKPLGLPEWAELAGSGFGGLCALAGIWVQRRAKRRGGQVPVLTPSQAKSRTRLMIVLVVIASLSGPFWLPYTGINLSFPQLIVVAIITCIFSVAAVLLGARLSSKA